MEAVWWTGGENTVEIASPGAVFFYDDAEGVELEVAVGGDGEGVPLELGHGGYVDEDRAQGFVF